MIALIQGAHLMTGEEIISATLALLATVVVVVWAFNWRV